MDHFDIITFLTFIIYEMVARGLSFRKLMPAVSKTTQIVTFGNIQLFTKQKNGIIKTKI